MAEFKLGRLRFVWQGDWTTGINYVKDDIVRYGGNTYVCVGAHTAASNFYTNYDDSKWELMSGGFEWKTLPWTSGTFYSERDVVRHGGRLYICVDGHTAASDFYTNYDAGKWQLFADGMQWKTSPWSTGQEYKENDLIRYGGKVYICVDGHTSAENFYTDLDAPNSNWQLFSDGVQWVGEWQASTWYKEGDIMRYGGKSYICVDGHTANLDFYTDFDAGEWQLINDGQQWKTSPWTKNTWYKEGDLVRYGGKVYICVDGHTSQNNDNGFYTDFDAPNSNWQLFSDGQQWKTSPWTASTYYKEGDIVRHGGKTYIAVNGHLSDSTIEGGFELDLANAEWQLFADGTQWRTTDWTEETYYRENDLVRYGGRIYICISGHVATSTTNRFDLDSANWQLFADGTQWKTTEWTASAYYKINDVVKYGGKTYIAIEDHYADDIQDGGFYTDLVADKWQLYADGNEWKGNWTVSTYYKLGDIVKYNGLVYVCSEGHTSAATEALGLEDNQLLWDTFAENFKFRNDWSPDVRYIVNDLVKFGSSIYNCTTKHTSGSTFDETKWAVFVGGLEFEDTWNANTEYQIGDVVTYGGYSYVATVRNTGVIPAGFPATWEVLTTGFKVMGEWSAAVSYKIGQVIHYGGTTFVARVDTTAGDTPYDENGDVSVKWEPIAQGFNWLGSWVGGTDYRVGDTIRWVANTYRCVLDHTSEEDSANQPDNDLDGIYWSPVAEGYEGNKLARRGDLLTRTATQNRRLARGLPGQVLKVDGLDVVWDYVNQVDKVYYVKTDGIDAPDRGTTLETAFGSIKYATEYILADEAHRAPATIFVKTGYYYEELPIIIPAQVAIVGDELRSTHVEPAVGRGIATITVTAGGTGYSLKPKAEVLLSANRTFLQEEIAAWINDQVLTNTGIWVNFTYDEATCYRDIGYIVDALIYDLNFGGTEKTNFAARRYWKGSVSKIGGQVDQSIASFNRLKDIINTYVLTNTTYAQSQNVYNQVTNSNNAEAGTSTRVTSLIGIITSVLTNGLTNAPAAELASNPITVTFSEPQIVGGTRPQVEARISNGSIIGFTVIKAGTGYTQSPIVDIVGLGSNAAAATTLTTHAYAQTSMYYMRDGSGLRNMTLNGLEGTLGPANANLTKRPLIETAYTSLDPGTGPGDESTWIVQRSPYVQNVSNFGTACYGLYVDGAIHNGGNKTIVCNDYTQLLNDGIGIYATNQGRVENVSVFCYYNHIGYLAENGGVIRSTNGNSSYGTYGVVAEGIDPTEVSRTASIDNQRLEAQVANTFVDGDSIVQIEYLNAGEGYSALGTTFSFSGTGNNDIVVSSVNVRNGGVKEVRVMSEGKDWMAAVNNAQSGDDLTIRLSASDTQVTDAYVGERIVIINGIGAGQYGYVATFNGGTKQSIVAKESFVTLTATASVGSSDLISVGNNSTLSLGQAIVFTGTGFGNIVPNNIYYVKTKPNGTQITISELANLSTTFNVSDGAGSLVVHAAGWESFQGVAIEPVLDTTTRYSIEPRVIFSTGAGATATGNISKGVNIISTSSSGANFQTAPSIIITGTETSAAGATATATISGEVVDVMLRESGRGYTGTPAVAFVGGGLPNGSPNHAEGTANLINTITEVTLIDGGVGFAQPPKVIISGNGYNDDAYISTRITNVVGAIDVTNAGTNYSSPPIVSITNGGGEGASATALLNAHVTGTILVEGGSGYSSGNTTVTIVPAAGDTSGSGAEATAIIDFGNPTGPGAITGFNIVHPGSGYIKAPIIIIDSPTGINATAIATISGSIASVVVDVRGRDYTSPPTINFVGGGGSGAIGVALLTGAVDALNIIDGGSGFTGEVTLQIQGITDFTYNETKCRRDVGIIVDAVTTDLVFGSNYASSAAGLAYLRSYASVVTDDQKAQTADSINEAKRLVLAQTTVAPAIAAITNNFEIITDILLYGEASAPALNYPIPADVDAGIGFAAVLLQANREFIVAETTAWISAQIIANLGTPFVSGFTYNSATCERDVGYIVDAVTYDLLYGGNGQSLNAANAYYNGTSLIAGQEDETVAAINFVKSLVADVIQGIDVTEGQSSVTQTLPASGEEGSAAAATATNALFTLITDVVADGTTATLLDDPTWALGDATNYDIKTDVMAVIEPIKNAVIQYIELTFMGGSGATATATIDSVVESVTITSGGTGYTRPPTVSITGGGGTGCLATAILNGTITAVTKSAPGSGYTTTPTVAFIGGKNFRSIIAGESYYRNVSSLTAIGFSQLTETLYAVEYIKNLIENIALNTDPVATRQVLVTRTTGALAPAGAFNQAAFWIDAIKAVMQNGNENTNASGILFDNVAFVAAEVVAWAAIPGNVSGSYTANDLRKRVKIITTAISDDLNTFGVNNSIAIGQQYANAFSGNSTDATALLTKINALSQDIIVNNTVTAINTDGITQTFAPLVSAEVTASTSITNCINLIKSLVALNYITGSSSNATFATLLKYNKHWIKAEVIEAVKAQYPAFDYNEVLCARDIGLIVDAIAFDITNSETSRAVATATTTNVLSTIDVVTGGAGYGAGTTVSFSDDVGNGLTPTATPIITNGVVTGFTITQAGSGFQDPPTVTINADTGTGAYARCYVLGGVIQELRIVHPGSGYSAAPYVALVDPNNTIEATLQVRIGNGVLDQPTFSNRGTGYLGAEAFVSGNGYADIYQTGEYIYVKNMTNVPTPGANVQFAGNDSFYKLVSVREVTGPSGVIGGRSLITSNKEFVKAQVIAAVNNQYSSLTYNEELCARDVGLIIDAINSDIFGDTEKGIEAGRAYFRNASALTSISGTQGLATVFAIEKIREYLESIVQNITVVRNQLQQLQVKEPLITTGEDCLPAVNETLDIILNIINEGDTLASVADLLLDNRTYIRSEIIAFINTTYPEFEYNETLCSRDVGLIVDAIAYDIYGGLNRSREVGLRYFTSASSRIAITTQFTETVAAINHIADVIIAVANNTNPDIVYQTSVARISNPSVTSTVAIDTKMQTCINEIVNIVTNGVDVLPAGQYTARLQVSPALTVNDVPEHNTSITIRSKYSQVRLSGHDFLNVGTGNKSETNYPGIPVNNPSQEREVLDAGGGRCFYTSTDQDGNFRVGELFRVEQATGVASLNAQAFNLSGLNELQLGGVTLGGTGAVINEFSTDSTFVANSDNIVPTQKAIRTYIASQLGSGGGNLAVNAVTAGDVAITGTEISTNADVLNIIVPDGVLISETLSSTSTTSGSLVVDGGVGIAENANIGGDVVITGNLTVNGTSTILNIDTLDVEDTNITIAKAKTTAAQANGAGITVNGPTTPATITYANVDDSWNMNKLFKATSIQNTPVGSSTRSTGAFTSLAANAGVAFTAGTSSTSTSSGTVVVTGGVGISENVYAGGAVTVSGLVTGGSFTSNGNATFSAANSAVTLSPTGTGSVAISPTGSGGLTINPTTTGTINNVSIGATTRSTGAFTTLTSNGATTFTAGTASSSTSTGTVVVTGGVGVSGNLNVGGSLGVTTDVTITGNLTVNGTTTTINSTTLSVDDAEIVIGDVASPTDTTANTGGIRLKGATDKTLQWLSATSRWTFNQGLEAASLQNTPIGSSTRSTGAFTTLDANSTVGLSPSNANVTISPTGTGTLTINPATAGTINAMSIGATTRSTGAFTTLAANNAVTFTAGTASTSTSTGTVVVTGGVGVSGAIYTGGIVDIANTTASSSTTTGALIVDGGAGIAGAIYGGSLQNTPIGSTTRSTALFTTLGANSTVSFTAGTSSTSTSSGTVVVTGGVGISENVYAGGLITAASIQNTPIGSSTRSSGAFTSLTANGSVTLTAGTASTSTTTGTLIVTGGVGISGALYAASKSFDIEHPTKPGMRLRHGSLEGPEFGVYVRGRLSGTNVIELPDYWTGLVDASTITVNLTAIGGKQDIWVEKIEGNKVYVGGDVKDCFYTVFGERKDIDRVVVEG